MRSYVLKESFRKKILPQNFPTYLIGTQLLIQESKGSDPTWEVGALQSGLYTTVFLKPWCKADFTRRFYANRGVKRTLHDGFTETVV